MRAISSKLNMYVRGVGLINNNIEKFFLNLILWSFGALVFLYLLFLGNMVKNIIERRGLEAETRVLSSEVANLELKYLSMTNVVDLAFSYRMGFKETKATFATRKALGLSNIHGKNIQIAQNDL